jgi:hypothetical protein
VEKKLSPGNKNRTSLLYFMSTKNSGVQLLLLMKQHSEMMYHMVKKTISVFVPVDVETIPEVGV